MSLEPLDSSKPVAPVGPGRVERARQAVARIPAQAERTVADVVRLLAAVVARLRTPLLVLLTIPLVEGVALIAVSAVRGGADLPIACVLAVLAAIPAGGSLYDAGSCSRPCNRRTRRPPTSTPSSVLPTCWPGSGPT